MVFEYSNRGASGSVGACRDVAQPARGLDLQDDVTRAAGGARRRAPRPLLTLLRRVTRERHRQLDADSALRPLNSGRCTLHQYATAMRALASVYACIDPLLDAAGLVLPDGLPVYCARGPVLQRDLSALGGDPLASPRGQSLARPRRLGSYLGMRYVVEGSTLGGTLIARQLAHAPVAAS